MNLGEDRSYQIDNLYLNVYKNIKQENKDVFAYNCTKE